MTEKNQLTWTEKTIKVKDLKPAEYNPRTISKEDFESLKRSLKKFGHAYPIVCNSNLKVIGGHQTLEAAKALGWDKIKVSVPSRLIPDEEERALNLALNKISGEWVDDTLGSLLASMNEETQSLTGFSNKEIKQLLNKLKSTGLDEIPEVPETPKSKTGELYSLGDHILLVGDSTKEEDVLRLMGGGSVIWSSQTRHTASKLRPLGETEKGSMGI